MIPIQGLTSGYDQPLDFCVPVTRTHPGDEDQRRELLHGETARNLSVEHIDISTAWNGLSDVDAKELFRVHQAFVSKLESMLANELWQIHQQFLQQDSAGNIRHIHTMFSAGIVRGISFCRDHLISEMAETLYSSEENAAKAKSGLLRLYLVANDVLVQHHENSSRDTSITVRMRCDPFSLPPYPSVDAAWVPDSLTFEGLDEVTIEGQSLSIVPRYYSKSAFRPTRFPKNVKYSIESESRRSSLSWLVWKNEIAGFEGNVPFYSEANGYDRHVADSNGAFGESISHSLKIIVQAVLIDDNGSSIRYERILRARLTIKVVPWYVNGQSCETKERMRAPKAYQDTRLVSAAQYFALKDPRGSLFYPGRSANLLSQWKKGAHSYTPIKSPHTGQVGLRDNHSALSFSATAGSHKTDLPSLAQTQEYLVIKCAELSRELENVKEQIIMFGPSAKPQESVNQNYRIPLDHDTRQNEPTSQSSIPGISDHAPEYPTTPSTPLLQGRDASFQLGPITRFSTLPPPATGLRKLPNSGAQIKGRSTLGVTYSGWDSTPEPGTRCPAPEVLLTQNMHSTQQPEYLWRSLGQASIPSNDTSTAPSLLRQDFEALSNPSMVKGELATISTYGERSRKGEPRSSLNEMAPSKLSKETGRQPQHESGACSAEPGRNALPQFDSEDEGSGSPTQWSGGIFYNSFGPLRNLRSSSTLGSEDTLASHASEVGASNISSKSIKNRNQLSDGHTNTEIPESDELAELSSPKSSSLSLNHGARLAEGVSSNSFFPSTKGQVRLRQNPSNPLSPRQSSTSSTSGSRSILSDTEFIIEQNPRAREVSRQEQARSWKLLSRSDSEKAKQPRLEIEEVRLSADEKRAMDEAMQRSLDDQADGFDDIFLEDSSESTSGDDDL